MGVQQEVTRVLDDTHVLLTTLQTGLSSSKSTKDAGVDSILHNLRNLKGKIEAQQLTVAVLALTKSGKSTFVNSLMADNILPSAVQPETARITRIVHDVDMSEPYLRGEGIAEVRGAQAIQRYLKAENERARSNNTVDERILDVFTPLACLGSPSTVGGKLDGDVRFTILDTPGPNEAGADYLKAKINRMLDEVDVLIYVLNYTLIGTDDEARIFESLKSVNPALLQSLAERLFFVVNKVDQMFAKTPEDLADIKQRVSESVTRQMNLAGFTLRPDQVFLLSAEEALLARTYLCSRATDKQKAELRAKFWGQALRLPGEEETVYPPEVWEAKCRLLFKHSGVGDVEAAVLDKIFQHRYRLHMKSVIDSASCLLQEVAEFALVNKTFLEADVKDLEDKGVALAMRTGKTMQMFQDVHAAAANVVLEVTREVEDELHRLAVELAENVEGVFSGDLARPNPLPMWKSALKRLGVVRDHTNIKEMKTAEAEAFKNKLKGMLDDISAAMTIQVTTFFAELESNIVQTQEERFRDINLQLNAVTKEVTSVLQDTVPNLQLQAVGRGQLKRIGAEEFHDKLEEVIVAGYTKRMSKEKYEEKEVRRVLIEEKCFARDVYGDKIFTTEKTRDVEVHQFNLKEIKEALLKVIAARTDESIKNVRGVVNKFLKDRIREMENETSALLARYKASIEAAIDTQNKDANARQEAMAQTIEAATAAAGLQAALRAIADKL